MREKFEDLTGKRFGRLTVIGKDEPHISPMGKKLIRWKCLCDCGNIKSVIANGLKNGTTKSCGCINGTDLVGESFGFLKVLKRAEPRQLPCGYKQQMWLCKCVCGKEVKVSHSHLITGHTKSCGCKSYVHKPQPHISEPRKTLNGRIHRIWANMKGRCFNPNDINHSNYGGRGIVVCQEWLNFQNFYDWAMANGYSDNLTIDRIDNDGNYEPSNCRWVDMKVQQNNKRNNRCVTLDGETHTLAEWARIYGLNPVTLASRIYKGWDIERAVKTPINLSYQRTR